MVQKGITRFFFSIIFPTIMAIGLFIGAVLLYLIPSIEENIMDRKKEMISELTNTAWSLLEENNNEYIDSILSLEEAQNNAIREIANMRYGSEGKDYFWIVDQQPKMIMHPYRSELIQSDLTNYKDPNGIRLFVEAVNIVEKSKAGYIDYMWQWKDDSTRIVPKLSYVKGYEPWGWIIGTGIYLEDVKEEIYVIKSRLIKISLVIIFTLVIILLFIVRNSLKIENSRRSAESDLILSRERYKSLVEASTEGTLMIRDGMIIFSNNKICKLGAYERGEVEEKGFDNLFKIKWKNVENQFIDTNRSLSVETQIICSDSSEKDVILSISKIQQNNSESFIIVTKEISSKKIFEKEMESLSQELQTSLLLMNQPIKPFIKEIVKCPIETSIYDATSFMLKKNVEVLFAHSQKKIIGIVTNNDFSKRVLAKGVSPDNMIMDIMSSPIKTIPETALFYEANLIFKNNKLTYIGVTNKNGEIIGALKNVDVLSMHHNSVSFIIKEIEDTENVKQIIQIYKKVPILVNALIQSGDKTRNISKIISSIADAITSRIIALGIEYIGEPPCKFAFMVTGSEGRMEQTLSTDQDNAIIFENQTNNDEFKDYFLKLGEYISMNLDRVGYRYCTGDNMANNPEWVQSYDTWKNYFNNWMEESNPQNILNASIFFDFRSVYGDESLVNELRNYVSERIVTKTAFFYNMAETILKYKTPIISTGKLFGTGNTDEENIIDIKKVLHPVVGFVRLYSLLHRSKETNSIARMQDLEEMKIFSKSFYDELIFSYDYLMHLRLRFQSESLLQSKQPDNEIDVNKLTHIEIASLKKILIELKTLQAKLKNDYSIN